MLGLGGRLGWVPPTPLTPVVAELLLLTVDKTGVEVVVGGSIEPLPLWLEKTGATLLIGLPVLLANLQY